MHRKLPWLLSALLAVAATNANAAFSIPTQDGQTWQQQADETLLSHPSFPKLGAGDWKIDYLGSLAGYNNALYYKANDEDKQFLFSNTPRADAVGDSRSVIVHVDENDDPLRFFLATNVRPKKDDDGDSKLKFDNRWSDHSKQAKWTQVGNGQSYRLYWEDLQWNHSDGDYNDFMISVSAVPEPETYALMLAGLALVGLAGSRKRKLPARS